MQSKKSSVPSPWPNISNLQLSTWLNNTSSKPSTSGAGASGSYSWQFDSQDLFSPRLVSSSEASPTYENKNPFTFESSLSSPGWNMDGLDKLAAKLLTISEDDSLVEPIISTSTPRLSPLPTVEGEAGLQTPSTSRSTPDLGSIKDDRSGDSSDPDGPLSGNSRFKTEICRNFKEKGQCLYGELCQFAHGSEEMRNVGQHNKYKTKRCQKYWIAGYCAYGPRCNFLHNEERDLVQQKPQILSTQNLVSQRRSDGLRKGSTGEYSGESSSTSPSSSPTSMKFKLPTTPVPLEVLHRPLHGSGRLAAYTVDGEFFWIDMRTQRYV